jgi:hypothetical protein
MADYFASLGASNKGFDQGAASAAANQRIAEAQAQALRDDQQRRIGQDMATSAFMQPAPSFDPSSVVGLKLPTVNTPMADPSKVKLMEDFSVPAPPPPPVVETPAAPAALVVPKPDAPAAPAEVAKADKVNKTNAAASVEFNKDQKLVQRNVPIIPTGGKDEYKFKVSEVPYQTGTVFDPMKQGSTVIANISNDKGIISHPAYLEERARILDKLGKAQLAIDPEWKVPGAPPPNIFSWNQLTTFNRDEANFYRDQLSFLDGSVKNAVAKGKATNDPITRPLTEPVKEAAKPDERAPVDALGGYALPASMEKRRVELSNKMPQKLEDPKLQGLVARAMQLGVDPATAVATYALENNYGGNAESLKGARGPLQIMPGTYSDMRNYYAASKDPALAALGNSLPIASMQAGKEWKWDDKVQLTPSQATDAGLLYMKYLKEVKNIPTNLMGAAYHAGANYDSYKNGFAPNVVDAGVDSKGRRYAVWTPDYNALHVSLYNQYASLTNGTALNTPVTANGVVGKGSDARNPMGAAPVDATGNQQVVINNSGAVRDIPSQVQMVNQPNAAANQPAAAVVSTAEVKAPVLEQIRVASNTPVEAYDAATKQLMSRHELITRQMGEGAKILDDSTRVNAVNLQAQRTQINNEARAAYAVGNTTIMNQKLKELQGVDAQIRQLDTTYRAQRMDFERQALGSTQTIENELWKVQSDLAIRDLANGDPRRMVQVARNYTGMPMDVQRRSDGSYNIYYPDPKNPGQMVTDPNKPKTTQELSAWFLTQTSETYRTNKATADAMLMSKAAEIQLQTNADIQKKLAEQVGEIRVTAASKGWDMAIEDLKKRGDIDVKMSGDGSGKVIFTTKDGTGRVFMYDPNREKTGPNKDIAPESFQSMGTISVGQPVGLNTANKK